MSYQLHRTMRNCKGQYPESTYARSGYKLGPLQINECPKTYVSRAAWTLIEAYDQSQISGIKFGLTMDSIPARYFDLCRTVEEERSNIRALIDWNNKAKATTEKDKLNG